MYSCPPLPIVLETERIKNSSPQGYKDGIVNHHACDLYCAKGLRILMPFQPSLQKSDFFHFSARVCPPSTPSTHPKQLRRVKSTVYLTGNQTDKTRRRMVDLLAPARCEVVAATANTSTSSARPSSYRSDSTAAVDTLESTDALGKPELSTGQASMDEYLGLLKDYPENSSSFAPGGGSDNDSEDFLDDSKVGISFGTGATKLLWGGGRGRQMEVVDEKSWSRCSNCCHSS